MHANRAGRMQESEGKKPPDLFFYYEFEKIQLIHSKYRLGGKCVDLGYYDCSIRTIDGFVDAMGTDTQPHNLNVSRLMLWRPCMTPHRCGAKNPTFPPAPSPCLAENGLKMCLCWDCFDIPVTVARSGPVFNTHIRTRKKLHSTNALDDGILIGN